MEVKDLKPNYAGEDEQKPQYFYTPEEAEYRGFLIRRMTDAATQREAEHVELDDMSYTAFYDSNAKSANSYLKPKENPEDTRIVTGTTQEKENTLLSTVLNYNLEPDIVALNDRDMEIRELGENMQDMVRKSRKIELYDDKRPLYYKELFDQGTCFIEEYLDDKMCIKKTMKEFSWDDGVKVNSVKWSEDIEKGYSECNTRLLSGKNVYLGNIREFFIHNQPYVFTRDEIPYSIAQTVYGDWDRFEFVPKKIVRTATDEGSIDYQDWTLEDTDLDKVEVLKYQDKWSNEFMIMLNGVMMLPVGFPLTAVSPSGEYSIAKGDSEPISKFFAISKSLPAKTKVDQAVLDEILRLFILKTKKSFMPPLGNMSNKVLSKKMFYPGVITKDLNPDLVKPIGDVTGVSQPEFAMFELMKRLIDEKTVSPVFSGDMSKGSTTATEIVELKKQSMMKLGYSLLGVISLERQLATLRVHNILANWTKSVDSRVDPAKGKIKEIYRRISVDTEVDGGAKGTKIIEFDEDKPEMYDSATVMREEELLSRPGKPVRKVYMNPKILQSLKTNWYIEITPTEKETDALDRLLFVQNLQDAATFFGIQSLNMGYLKQRFAILAGEDPEKYFTQQQQQLPPGAEEQGQPQQTGGDAMAQLMQGAKAQTRKPSVNTMMK